MIKVERGPEPEFVHDPAFVEAREAYERFRLEGGARMTQKTRDFGSTLGPYQIVAAEYAFRVFHGKCAYSEVTAGPHLHLHRPEGDAYDDALPPAPNHYWWTAFWYRNWYNASPEVASLKRNVFPVIGERAQEPSRDWLHGEMPEELLDRGVLLDPCEDDPLLHLRFTEDGRVVPWAEPTARWLSDEESRRGSTTIDLLGLNSRMLLGSRRKALRPILATPHISMEFAVRLLQPELEHLGAVRQVIAARLVSSETGTLTDVMRLVAPEIVPHVLAQPERFAHGFVADLGARLAEIDPGLAERVAPPRLETSGAEPEPIEPSEPTAPPPPPTPPGGAVPPTQQPVIGRTAVITRIRIENFQAIELCEIDVPGAIDTLRTSPEPLLKATGTPVSAPSVISAEARPWRVFLGENGSGKSSALRAIALALAGDGVDALMDSCDLEWSDMVRRGTLAARVLLEFTGGATIDLAFTAAGPTAESRANLPRVECFARGFGATRLKGDPASELIGNVRLGNLFDPLHPVVDAQQWLLSLEARPDQGDFNVAAVAIARLLNRHEQVVDTGDPDAPKFIKRVGEEIWLADEPLRTLSDGYRAIITLACDLMAGAGSGLSDMRNAGGVVLIDELGCYLHPRWKMQITRTLRDVFPSMQFLVTTHEPLCLRGLVEHEVVRVTRSSDRLGVPWHALFDEIEESPSRYRVDRLLTSSFFGLDTTIDPDVESEFQEYYTLIRRTDLDSGEEQLRDQLRARLSRHGILGYTARDQLVYDAIDEFLATSPQLDPEQRRQERRATLDKVVDIWQRVAATHDTGTP